MTAGVIWRAYHEAERLYCHGLTSHLYRQRIGWERWDRLRQQRDVFERRLGRIFRAYDASTARERGPR